MSSQIKLAIRINNKRPIELNSLTNSLNALGREYDLFCKDQFGDMTKNDRKLQIVGLEKSCLLIELVPVIVPLIQEMNAVLCFGKYLIQVIDFFTDKSNAQNPPGNFGKKNCDNMTIFLEQGANDKGSNYHLSIIGDNNTIIAERPVDCPECNIGQNNLAKYRAALLEEEPLIMHKQALYWETASFVKGSSGKRDRGIIETIDKKPRKIVFNNESDKKFMTTSSGQYQKEWQDLIYIVDVEAVKVQDIIKFYKILRIYEEDTFEGD